jgi:glycosyltransferase involved in cell wall biosynthesis
MASRIQLHLEPLPTQRDVARAIQRAHCGVFCSRAEGWNLEALEVLSMGKPLIATYYSAHTEFLTPENAHLVEIDSLERRGVGHWAAFGARQEEALIAHLRAVHRQRLEGALKPNVAGIRTATFFSWEHAARCLLRAVAAAA